MEGKASMPVVAVDLGGTNTRVAIVDPDGTIRDRDVEPTARMEEHPGNLIMLVRRIAGEADVERAVIGVPGRIDFRTGRLEYAPNLPVHWATHLTEVELADGIGMPVALANDADLAAVGEHRFGAGRGSMDMVYVTMSTGVGGGAIVGGKLLHGRRSLAEVGHMTIDRRAPEGSRTFEGSASGTALNRMAAERGLSLRGRELVDAVRAGDGRAREVWNEVVTAAGFGFASLAHLYSPEVIVIGGGLGLNDDLLHEPVAAAVQRYGPKDLPEPIRIARAELGDDAGLAGAAGWTDAFVPDVIAAPV
jgi:glucokinase